MNFLFFEKGFQKLSLREVRLRLGDKKGKNSNNVVCAVTSDYSPIIENYGFYFAPLARIGVNHMYMQSEEYKLRKKVLEELFKERKSHYEDIII